MKSDKVYFVYQCWKDERLYSSSLTEEEANEAQKELDRLIESGCCGDGCAVQGRLDDPDNADLCARLGILDEWQEHNQNKHIYVTYKRTLHDGTVARFAIQCEDMEQAYQAGYDLRSRPNVRYVRINTSGKSLPSESHIFFFNEYMNLK